MDAQTLMTLKNGALRILMNLAHLKAMENVLETVKAVCWLI